MHHRTRSKTKVARDSAAKKAAAEKQAHLLLQKLHPKPRRRRGTPRPSSRPKKVRIGPSQIQGAGLGLFLTEGADKNEWIARYSGDPLTKAECGKRRCSHYRLQVHKNLYLDAADKKHFEGRFINDARGSKFKTNARFAANYATNTCSRTGLKWVRI